MLFHNKILLSLFLMISAQQQLSCASEKIVYKQNDQFLCNPIRMDRTTQEIVEPSMIVVGYTCQPEALESAMALKKGRASTHYIIDKDGIIYETMHKMPKSVTTIDPEYLQQRAWHAGHGYWNTDKQEITDVNSHSIGILFVNEGALPQDNPNVLTGDPENNTQWFDFSEEQQSAFLMLSQQLKAQYHIDDKDIVGHGEIAINPATKSLGRKVGPGPKFPWKKIAEQGVGVHHNLCEEELNQPCAIQPKDLQELLKAWGYSIKVTEVADNQTQQAVFQAQMHHDQQQIDGNCQSSRTYHIMQSLLAQRYKKSQQSSSQNTSTSRATESENAV